METYRRAFDRFAVRLDAEDAHEAAIKAMQVSGAALAGVHQITARERAEPVSLLGHRFANRLGVAAGLDKNARAIDALGALGFGHVEIGTVTARAQPGNPRPRLFRLPEDDAILNRMGFNNDGAAVVAARLHRRRRRFWAREAPHGPVIGVNIGKTKVVDENDQTACENDYATSARLLSPFADYLVVNVSSPNTPGLRSLQAVERLGPLLQRVRDVAHHTADREVPLLVKIAPDLSDEDLLEIADLVTETGLAGVVATNTTISREGLTRDADEVAALGAGGVSGAPLTDRACEVMRILRQRLGPEPTLIGAGGISTVGDARARVDAGADLLQAYSGFVYGGPTWPRRIVKGLDG